ncbi:MAG: zinc ribbon domain-containing protein [Gemmatimonadota bacterium]
MALCPSCGSDAAGLFCAACGAPVGAAHCSSCGAALSPGSRFCASCGQGIGSSSRPPARSKLTLLPVIAGGLAIVALLVVLYRSDSRARQAASVPEPEPEAAPPDLGSMTPRERFDRLYDRVMRATEKGDQATVDRFGQMALAAYGMLDQVDTDARYHAVLLRLHLNDADGARQLVDTIVRTANGHLFGYLAQGMMARWKSDSAALEAAYRGYVGRYDTELAKHLDEYTAHKTMLDQFLTDAKAALARRPGGLPAGEAPR